MCGHVGIISRDALSTKEKTLFTTMMILSTTRGKDSTGILGVEFKDSGDLYGISKGAKRAEDYLREKEAMNLITDKNNILLGHVRAATIGIISKETAHPYEQGTLIGFHNGTIRNYKEKDDLTDSSKFYRIAAEKGFKEALEELPRDAAYAFVFYDKSNGLVHLFRNKRRDLFLCVSKDNKTLLYASEARFIKAGLQYVEMTDKFGDPYELNTNTLVHVGYEKDSKVLKFDVTKDYLDKEVIEKHEKTGPEGNWGNFYTGPRVVRAGMGGNHGGSASQGYIPPRLLPSPSGTGGNRRKGVGKPEYPFTEYEFNPCYNKIRRTIRKGEKNYTTSFFYSGHSNYLRELEECKKQLILDAGGCYVEIEESTFDFHVSIPGKKKIRTRVIRNDDDRWDGWWSAMTMISDIWEVQCNRHAMMSHDDFLPPRELVFSYNELHSYAAKVANETEKKRNERKQRLEEIASAQDVIEGRAEFDDPIPFEDAEELRAAFDEYDQETVYIGFMGEELSLDEAAHRLGNSCCNCFETSSVNDTVYWINSKEYVCEPCTGLQVIQQHLNLSNSTLGGLKTEVKRMMN